MENKQKITRKSKANNGGSLLRTLTLVFGVISALLFLYFVYLFVVNSRQLSSAQEIINGQVILVNDMEKQYDSLLEGRSLPELKKSIAQFDNGLKSIEGMQAGASSATHRAELQKVKSEWAQLKGFLDDEVLAQTKVKDIRKNLTDVFVALSDIKLASSRLNIVLSRNANVSQLKRNLNEMNLITTRLDNVTKVILSDDLSPDDYNEVFKGQLEKLTQFYQKIDQELALLGDKAYQDVAQGKKLRAAIGDQFKLIKDSVAGADQMFAALGASDESVNLSPLVSSLSSNLLTLKASYSNKGIYPFAGVPLTYLGWVVLWLAAAVVLLTIWAMLVIRNAAKINKEATRLRVAAEDRAQNDQEAILRLMDDLGDLSEGDLTIEAQVTEDFTGAIADSINFTVENMRDMVGTITHTSDEITRATAISSNVSRLLSDSSAEQSKQIDTSAATVRQMSSSLHEIAENTDSSVEIARSSVNIAQEGRSRVFSTIKSMSDIRENIQETAKRIKRLGESSQEIGDIVEIIKDIADQTNVLALNAAIQATAAGEAGRGFAVVADEVQRLAERSTNATKRIEILVKRIQADANEAVSSMENSTKQVVTGTDVAEEAPIWIACLNSMKKPFKMLPSRLSQLKTCVNCLLH